MYDHHYSRQTVSNISDSIFEELEAFKNRPVRDRYAVFYCDATFLPVRRDTVSKEALHVIIGITEERYKEVLSFAVYPTESANNYREMLQDLKLRGLENVLLFVSDELTGLSDTLTDEFSQSKHQSCWTHIMRNISKKVRARDKAEVLQDLKQVYNKETIDEALEKLNTFFDKWGKKYPKVSLQGKDNLFTFMLFPSSIRSSIYTNNIVEGLKSANGQLHPVQKAFIEEAAVQCGFCTPGLILSAVVIAGKKQRYTREELRRMISGHLCRCTGYENILRAVEKAIETNIANEQ